MKIKPKKLFNWIVINGFITACFYYGITHRNGLVGLAQALTWLNAFICFSIVLMVLGDTPEAKQRRATFTKKTPNPFELSVPQWLALGYDLTLSAYLAYNAYVFTGLALLSSYFFQRLIYEQFEQDIAEAKASEVPLTAPHSHASPPEHSPHNS